MNDMEDLKIEDLVSGKTDKRNFLISNKLDILSILQNTSDSIWAIDTSYHLLYANHVLVSKFYKHFGVVLKPDDNILFSLPEALRDKWKHHYDRVLGNETFSFVENVQLEHYSLYVEVFMNPILADGNVEGAWFIGKDITQRKQAEKALEDAQQLLKFSLESQNDVILFSINKDYKYLYFNKGHYNVMKFAYGKDIKVGMNILDCITSDEDRVAAKENYYRALCGEPHSNVKIYGEENYAYYESFFNPMINEKNEIIGATILARDITERKKAEISLMESERKFKDLNATKDKLFAIIAHDLRTPFHTIIGFSDLMVSNFHSLDAKESKKFLNIINSSAKNTLVILDNLLNWAASQTNQIRFDPEKIILSKIIHTVIKLISSQAKAKNISLNYLFKDDIEVYADENMLRIILRNLISNAIKFTPEGGQIDASATTKPDRMEICISDTGIGMNAKKMKSLFNVSSNKTTSGTANERGSGLGLILCKEFVEKHKGEIWVESEVGKGSNFKFTLPLKK